MKGMLNFLTASTWTGLILVGCLLPSRYLPISEHGGRIPHADKVVHFALFAGFGLLWGARAISGRQVCVVAAAGLAMAVGTELGQGLEAIARDPDIFDALADVVGLAVGLALARPLAARSTSRPDGAPEADQAQAAQG